MDAHAERSLVGRLKAGDESAFDAVYQAYRRQLYAFLIRLTRDRDLAEDLLEETWLRLVDRVGTLRDDSKLGAWLFAVARNLFLSHRRSRVFDGGAVGGPGEAAELTDPGPSPFETTAANELAGRVEHGLAALPVAYREVLLLVGVHGMTPSEAAAICELSPEALRQRLLRARRMLAGWLREAGMHADNHTRSDSAADAGPA